MSENTSAGWETERLPENATRAIPPREDQPPTEVERMAKALHDTDPSHAGCELDAEGHGPSGWAYYLRWAEAILARVDARPLTARDALARAACATGNPDHYHGEAADRLLASGALVDATALADEWDSIANRLRARATQATVTDRLDRREANVWAVAAGRLRALANR